MFLLTIIILGIFEIYLLSIIFRAKNVAKVQQIFQLCKFFAKKIYQQFLKVIQNKIVNRSFTAFYNFYNVEKFSKIKNHLFTSVFHCVSLSTTSKNLKSPVNSYKNAHLFAYIKYFYKKERPRKVALSFSPSRGPGGFTRCGLRRTLDRRLSRGKR